MKGGLGERKGRHWGLRGQKLEQQVAEVQAANRAQLVKVQMVLIGE